MIYENASYVSPNTVRGMEPAAAASPCCCCPAARHPSRAGVADRCCGNIECPRPHSLCLVLTPATPYPCLRCFCGWRRSGRC